MIQNNIVRAAQELKLLKISYVDKKNIHTTRTVEPYEIKNGKLWGHCVAKNGIRQFDINQIIQAVVQDKTFVPRHPVKINGPSV